MSETVASILPELETLWNESRGDPSICIAFLDGRANLEHPCFNGAEIFEIIPAWRQNLPNERNSDHGTHVASIVFGQWDGPLKGVAPRCRGLVIPVYNQNQAGTLASCSQLDLARAISLARSEGAHIINVSGGQLTPTGEASSFLADEVAKCANQGVLIVAATGNDGCECLHVPAALPTVLAVGAADAAGQPLGFSNWGKKFSANGILAPGENIPGAVGGDQIGLRTGTSFAAPIVSAVAALLLSIQNERGQKPDPAAVRRAILTSAIGCSPDDTASDSTRMLAGRLNPAGALARLFPDTVQPNLLSDIASTGTGVHHTPFVHGDSGIAPHGPDETTQEDTTMVDQASNEAVTLSAVQSQLGQLQALVQQLQGAINTNPYAGAAPIPSPPVAPSLPPAAAEATHPSEHHGSAAVARVPAVVPDPTQKPAPCGCGGKVSPSETTVGQMPENDFITYRNSQLIFSVGELGYDFGTEARRDYFVQRFRSVFQDERLRQKAGVSEGHLPLPENYKAMAAYLKAFEIDPQYTDTQADANALIWTLTIDAIPVYEIRPMGNFDLIVFMTLMDFLKDIADGSVDKISVAGRIIGSKRLYNGSVVPTIEPTLRGMASWEPSKLIDHLIELFKKDSSKIITLQGEGEEELRTRLRNFLNRIYYGLRNLGQAPDDRAINYLATNAFDAGEVFIEAAKEKYELDSITAEQSSICRPESLCFDVMMTFFDPTHRQERARKQYRRTVDVSDVVPVNVGSIRSWYVY